MTQALLKSVEQSQLKTDLPKISVGDTVDVHYRIIEGSKERIQVFSGVVIKVQGTGLTATFTVRRIVANEGVERTFPMHSPKIAKIEIQRHGHARRSKLYYLRERVGKSRRLADRRRGLQHLEGVIAAPLKKRKKGKAKDVDVPSDESPSVTAEETGSEE